MKKIFLVIIALVLMISCRLTAKDKFILTATYNKNFFSKNVIDMYGLNLEIFVTKNVSINYSLLLGSDGRDLALHTTVGVIGGINMIGYMFDDHDEEDYSNPAEVFYATSAILVLLPEGVNIHIPMSQYVSLVPFIHPLGYEYIANDRTLSSTVGLKVMYNINERIVLIPHFGLSLYYATENHTGYNFGISAGVKF